VHRVCALAAALWLTAGCGSSCNDEGRAGITLTIVDAGSGEKICDARVRYETPDLVTFGTGGTACEYTAARTPGTYVVTVERMGYVAQTTTIVVGEDDCGAADPESRTIALVRE